MVEQKEEVMKISKSTHTRLSYLKLEFDVKTFDEVINLLVKEHINRPNKKDRSKI